MYNISYVSYFEGIIEEEISDLHEALDRVKDLVSSGYVTTIKWEG